MSKLNYEKAYNELLEIVQEIEQNQVGIDDLNKKLKRAADLIKFCKNKLRDTESRANELINEFDEAN